MHFQFNAKMLKTTTKTNIDREAYRKAIKTLDTQRSQFVGEAVELRNGWKRELINQFKAIYSEHYEHEEN